MFNSTTLPNGLRIASYFMPGFGSVRITILVKAGGRYEEANEHGISHFLEHMAFKGTKTRTYKQIAQEFDDIGGRFNAATAKETTIYYAKVLAEKMHIALDILADILRNSVFDKDEMEKEKMVVLQEMGESHDNIEQLNYDNFIEQAFNNQPIGKTILGTEESLKAFDKEMLEAYIKKHYVAKNVIVSVSGNVKHDQLVKQVQELFGDLPTTQPKSSAKAYYTPGIKLLDKDCKQTTFTWGFASASYKDLQAFYKTEMLALVLGGGISSKLFQNIREEYGLTYSIGAAFHSYSDIGLFYVYASSGNDNGIEVLDKIHLEITKVCESISEEDIQRVKNQIRANLIMDEELVSYKSEIIAHDIALLGKTITTKEILQYIDSFNSADLIDQAQKIFSSKSVFSGIGKKLSKKYDIINSKISTSII
ncbi:hypothetical protein phytr_4380 [Candidatus Phycorickettsia trachydisci]|uniref:Peptidase M16 n=1 Tax=Candidatus Phycorickettsia trachydisci TaxID=2115978 RepID=A0A2P1P7Y9_9RICK|nr:pitrilysin family protein [Candidatus Phycorickettsia trachydisci]AVP87388.1 hypothetical protein phytr_4380 [Candidatus Phycorickettsia trachydisci]